MRIAGLEKKNNGEKAGRKKAPGERTNPISEAIG